jgi:hypothetical protein
MDFAARVDDYNGLKWSFVRSARHCGVFFMLCFVCFWGSDAPPYEPNEACPFPPVNIFFKSFPTIP